MVCRSLARSGELLERALARHGVAAASARRVPLGAHGARARAAGAGALCAAQRRRAAHAPRTCSPTCGTRALRRASRPSTGSSAEVRRARRAGRVARAMRGAGAAAWRLRGARAAAARAATRPPSRRAPSTAPLLAAPAPRRRAAARGRRAARRACAPRALLSALEELEQLGGAAASGRGADRAARGVAGPGPRRRRRPGAVLIAEPLAIRARRFRRVFVTGLCEGEFPAAAGRDDPFLGDERRRELALASGLALPPVEDPLDARALPALRVRLARDRARHPQLPQLRRGRQPRDPLAVPRRRRRAVRAGVARAPPPAAAGRRRLDPGGGADRSRAGAGAAFAACAGAAAARRAPRRRRRAVLAEQALAHVRHREVVSGGALEAFAACPVRWLVERQLAARRARARARAARRAASSCTPCSSGVFARLGGPVTPDRCPSASAAASRSSRPSCRRRLALGRASRPRSAPRSCAGSRRICAATCVTRPPTAATGCRRRSSCGSGSTQDDRSAAAGGRAGRR